MMKKIGLVSLILLFGLLAEPGRADILIIAHQGVTETTLTPKELQEIFLGKRVQWQDNTTILPITTRDPDLLKAFLERCLKKSLAQWNAHWKRVVFTGTGTLPEQVDTQQQLLEYVANTTGAIGYIDAATPVERVKIITVK